MAKISTYPHASSPQLSDMLIGSEVGDNNATKNFLISDIIGLANLGQFVPYTGATGNVNLGTYGLTSSGLATTTLSATGASNFTGVASFINSSFFNASAKFAATIVDGLNSVGTSNEVLTSIGTGVRWKSCNLQFVLNTGNTATGNINLTGNIGLTGNLNLSGDINQTGDINLIGDIVQTGDIGLTGDINQSGDINLTGDIIQTGDINLTGVIYADQAKIDQELWCVGILKDSSGTSGITGQVLKSTTTGVQWGAETEALYGMFYSDIIQSVTPGTPRPMVFNQVVFSSGVSVNADTFGNKTWIQVTEKGKYNIHFSAQMVKNTGGGAENVDIWFVNEGVNLPWSNRKITLQDLLHYTVASWDIIAEIDVGERFQIMWHQTGGNIQLTTIAAQSSPTRPETPSVMLTVSKVI